MIMKDILTARGYTLVVKPGSSEEETIRNIMDACVVDSKRYYDGHDIPYFYTTINIFLKMLTSNYDGCRLYEDDREWLMATLRVKGIIVLDELPEQKQKGLTMDLINSMVSMFVNDVGDLKTYFMISSVITEIRKVQKIARPMLYGHYGIG